MTTYDFEKYEQERIARGKEGLRGLTEQFKSMEIAHVVAYFDGEGDEGQISEVLYLKADVDEDELAGARSEGDISTGTKIHEPGLMGQDGKAVDIEDYIHELCPAGYEINEGGFGAVIFDVETGRIRVNSAARYTDFSTEDYEVK